MMEYRIDLKGVTSREDLHERIAQALQLPEWYGRNLDSLHDMLTAMDGVITVTGYDDEEKSLNGYVQGFRMVCLDALEENRELQIIFRDDVEDYDWADAEESVWGDEEEAPGADADKSAESLL